MLSGVFVNDGKSPADDIDNGELVMDWSVVEIDSLDIDDDDDDDMECNVSISFIDFTGKVVTVLLIVFNIATNTFTLTFNSLFLSISYTFNESESFHISPTNHTTI